MLPCLLEDRGCCQMPSPSGKIERCFASDAPRPFVCPALKQKCGNNRCWSDVCPSPVSVAQCRFHLGIDGGVERSETIGTGSIHLGTFVQEVGYDLFVECLNCNFEWGKSIPVSHVDANKPSVEQPIHNIDPLHEDGLTEDLRKIVGRDDSVAEGSPELQQRKSLNEASDLVEEQHEFTKEDLSQSP